MAAVTIDPLLGALCKAHPAMIPATLRATIRAVIAANFPVHVPVRPAPIAVTPTQKQRAAEREVMQSIVAVVSGFYGVSITEMMAQRRLWRAMRPRHVACYLIKQRVGNPYADIALFFGRHESSVQYAHEVVRSALITSDELQSHIAEITSRLEGRAAA